MAEKFESQKCNYEAPEDKEAIAAFHKEITEGLIRPSRYGLKFRDKDVIAYRDLKGKLTPKQYFSYLSEFVESPEDVWIIVSALQWVQNGGHQDILKEPHKTLVEGGGDCDNLALVAKKLLEDLGCRNGHDYNPRVIGNSAGQHAVCVFTDKDKKMYVMDEKSEIKEVPGKDIYKASQRFKRFEDPKQDNIYEEFLGPDGKFRVQIFVNEKTLQLKKGWVVLQIFNKKYDPESFDIKQYISAGFLRGKVIEVNFADGVSLFYRNGKVVQENYPDGSKLRYMGNHLLKEYPENHGLINETLDPKTRIVRQKNFRHKFYGRYAIEWYDKEGNIIKRQSWDGKIEKL